MNSFYGQHMSAKSARLIPIVLDILLGYEGIMRHLACVSQLLRIMWIIIAILRWNTNKYGGAGGTSNFF